MKFLTKKQIIQFNKATIVAHGGNFIPPANFLHEENLDYLLEIVQSEMFGDEVYPAISDKAAVYCYNIICNHIFTDGNKRTGLAAALIFLNLNNLDIMQSIDDERMTSFIIEIASGKINLDECRTWFKNNVVIRIRHGLVEDI
ncbi:MAG: type II toxin-antitoxin system death-on-curing family toxin [Saprospiraceae bacterium]|nr:type II toxin-antitoxin system death-on-curing family toxin [Saprospiraceae bacterium]